MGKKRKFNRFIRWIKSDLPDDNKSVLLLGVTKLPSPTPVRARPHTVHLDQLAAAATATVKSQTLDNQPRFKPRLFRSHSGDSLNELLTVKLKDITVEKTNQKFIKKVSFDTENKTSCLPINSTCFNTTTINKKLGFCTEQPYDFYHPNRSNSSGKFYSHDVVTPQDFIMDKSVDSIGSCSLDVDASSTDFSDSSVGSSDCTLRSLGVPTPTTTQQPSFQIQTITVDVIEPKKPSYLNLACTVNGYSNITNYDSKLRENFRIPRSREVSPIRPQDYHANSNNIVVESTEKSKFLTPNYQKSLLNSSPSSKNKMTESKSQSILRSSSTSTTSYSYSSKSSYVETKKFLYSDTVDQAGFHHTNGVTKYSSINGKTSRSENYINGEQKNKSFIQQRVERLYGPGALAQGFFITKRTKNQLSESSENGDLNNSFNTNSNKIETHLETIESKENDVNIRQSSSTPSLPVLRHLRPEFRAQLPILSPKRMNTENSLIQKSTTVPSSLTAAAQNGIEDNTKQLINGSQTTTSENKENILEIPAAPQVILPVTINNNNKINGNVTTKQPVKDGHYFLHILKNETERLIGLAVKAEEELEANKLILSDEQLGYLRSASGKARLLVTQKMQQFEGLCHKNINQIAGEQFPTTAEDLQGFWDMVMLQVTQIDDLFAELDRLRSNNWIIEEKVKPGTSNTSNIKKLVVKKPVSANTEAQRKQREAARKQMIEERRKAMRDAKQSQNDRKNDQTIEIFVPEFTS